MNVKTVRYGTPDSAREFAQSLRETGFAVLTGHPIPANLIADAFAEWAHYFSGDSKHQDVFEAKSQTGFFPFRTENAKGSSVKDLKEFYHHYPMRRPLPQSVREFTPDLYNRLLQLGNELLEWLERETPIEVRRLLPMHLRDMVQESDENLLRILHYPPLQGNEEPGAVRAAAHEDINLITLLPAATAPGLQVLDVHGRWHEVACDPGMIVVNAGDMLRETTRGYYPSTTHRVVNPTGPEVTSSRYSMPLFVHARSDARLTETLTASDYLNERLREIGLRT
jgi:isopenicillin N synthase-like dioxygenase